MEDELCDGNNNQQTNDDQEHHEAKSEILTSEQQDALKQAFDDIDVDQSGTINKSELRAALQLIGQNPTAAEIEKYMEGSSEEGEFTKQEFFNFIEQHVPLKTAEQINQELMEAFEKFDEDKDLFISRDEFRRLMTKKGDEPLTETEADDLMDRLDTAGEDGKDGKLSIVELGKLFIGDV